MKRVILAASLSVLCLVPAAGQERRYHLLRGHLLQQESRPWRSTWDIEGDCRANDSSSVKSKSGSGTQGGVRAVNSKVAPIPPRSSSPEDSDDSNDLEVLETLLSSPPYQPPPLPPPPPPVPVPAPVLPANIMQDACAHGYSPTTCPFGYNGNSNGSPYLSGQGFLRMRPDRLGGFRFYTSSGACGSMRPDHLGGYQIRVY